MLAVFQKVDSSTLRAADEGADTFLRRVKLGEGALVTVKAFRNLKFHRKFFTLLDLAYDAWEMPDSLEHHGKPVLRDRERFREEVLILAGFYTATYSVDGSVSLKAKSMSFANCDDFEFEAVYRACLNVIWDRLLKHQHYRSVEDLDSIVNQLVSYL